MFHTRRSRQWLAPLAAVLFACITALALHATASAQEIVLPQEPAASAAQTDLRINELMADNNVTLSDPDEPGEAPDWIEVYNPTAVAVSLDGLALTDDLENLVKFPITSGLTIPAHGFIVFYADEDPRQGPTHTNFKLSQNGEYVALVKIDGLGIIDDFGFGGFGDFSYPALQTDQSFGRLPDGGPTVGFLGFATPGVANGGDPPRIQSVSKPPVPAPANLPVTVTATITDIDAIVAATIVYSTTAGGVQQAPMLAIGGEEYAGQIPGLPAGVLVTYYVTAEDEDGESSRLPLPGKERRYLTGYLPPNLILNEIAYWNVTLRDPDEPGEVGEYPDWIEIYNPTATPISLNGLSLSDDKDDPLKHRIPAGLVVPAFGRRVFLADDDPGQGPLHLSFELKREGEYVGLYGGEGTVKIDSYDPQAESRIGASGRIPDGSAANDVWVDTVCPTPGDVNRNCDRAQFLPSVSR